MQSDDSASQSDFPTFTATLRSYGGFWGWDKTTDEEDAAWKVHVAAPGEYSIKVTAPADWDFSGVFCLETDLTELPKGYTISGKTAKLGNTTYDWTAADAHKDVSIRLGIWNEWGKDEYGEWNPKDNPISYTYINNKINTSKIIITALGDYTVRGTVPQNADAGPDSLFLSTSLDKMPTQYGIVGKTIKINEKEYDWSKAEAYRSGSVQLSVFDKNSTDERRNPLAEEIDIKPGDTVEATFTVTEPNLKPDYTALLSSSPNIWLPDFKIRQGDDLEFTFTVKALENASLDDFPSFTATLMSYGGFWGWDKTTDKENEAWKVNVTAPGEYSIKVTAPSDWSFLGAFCIETSLFELPRDYTISGKTAKIGDATFDWSKAELLKNNDNFQLSIWNEWGDIKFNPLFPDYVESNTTSKTVIREFGEYTLKITATQDADSHTGSLYIALGNELLPYHSIVGKTLKVGNKVYDWSMASAYMHNYAFDDDGFDYTNLRLSLWDNKSKDSRANPITEDIHIQKGDVIEATFSVSENPDYFPDITATMTSDHSIWKSRTPKREIISTTYPKVAKDDILEFTFTIEKKNDAPQANFPAFTATLMSYGGFWSWDKTTDEEDDAWKVNVDAPGEYTIKVTAPADWDFSGVFCLETDLTELPEGYRIFGKTARLGEKTYDWSPAQAYIDVGVKKTCLGIWNEWLKDENGEWDPKGNPLIKNTYAEDWMSEDWVSAEEWTTAASHYGDHTLRGVAIQDATSRSGALSIDTDLLDIPKRCTITGKTVTIAGKEYDWSKAAAYRKSDGTIALSLWDANDSSELANPLGENIKIKAGDLIEATFMIQKNTSALQTPEPTGTPTPAITPTAAPTDTPATTDTSAPSATPTAAPTDTPATTDTPAPTNAPDSSKKPVVSSTPKPTVLAKNKTFASGSLKYKVTTAAKKKALAKVSVIGLSPTGKKASSINVKNTVSYSGISYKVTAICGSAFKNSAKLTKATLGTNIESIAPNAFNGCKKLVSIAALGATKISQNAFKNCKALKKLTLRERISVKKGAFKGCENTIKVTGSSKKINKANVKKLKKCGYKQFK